MLDGVKDPRADKARHILFTAANGLEWLYHATKTNPYDTQIDPKARLAEEQAAAQRDQDLAKQQAQDLSQRSENDTKSGGEKVAEENGVDTTRKGDNDTSQQHENETSEQPVKKVVADHENEFAKPAKADPVWPWKQTSLHPLVTSMPASAETSIKSVAQYIAKHERDPVKRIKALHDYVADRIAYDSEALYSGKFPDQDAETTFRTHKSVCAGYANLLSALGRAINEQIVVVTGNARDRMSANKLSGMGHAWNAARIGHRWYLIDACWDAGTVNNKEEGFKKSYKTDYLLPPPEVMIEDHFPEKPTWQLLAHPLSQGDFLRQPMLCPSFQAADLTLVAPSRALNETEQNAVVQVKNPKHRWLMAGLEQNGVQIGSASDSINDETARLEYPLPAKGTYRLNMFVNPREQYGPYEFVGSIDFVNR